MWHIFKTHFKFRSIYTTKIYEKIYEKKIYLVLFFKKFISFHVLFIYITFLKLFQSCGIIVSFSSHKYLTVVRQQKTTQKMNSEWLSFSKVNDCQVFYSYVDYSDTLILTSDFNEKQHMVLNNMYIQ